MTMQIGVAKIRITLTEECLGTSSNNPDIHSEFIASKAPDAPSRAEEIASIGTEKAMEKAITIFPTFENGEPLIWDYQFRGFIKEATSMLARIEGSEASRLQAHRKICDGLIFVHPRKIALLSPNEKSVKDQMGLCTRPLRGQTAQGERISLATSETVPAGTFFDIAIEIPKLKAKKDDATGKKEPVVDLEKLIYEVLDYGSRRGLLQWRNSGKGTFSWKLIEEEAKSEKASKKK